MSERLNDGFRVITQEETPLYRAHVLLFDILGEGHTYDRYDIVKRDVDVYASTNGPVVGSAHIFDAGRGLVEALLVFDFHSPERLDLEIDKPIYAVPIGGYEFDNGKVASINVDGIVLSSSSGSRSYRITPVPYPST